MPSLLRFVAPDGTEVTASRFERSETEKYRWAGHIHIVARIDGRDVKYVVTPKKALYQKILDMGFNTMTEKQICHKTPIRQAPVPGTNDYFADEESGKIKKIKKKLAEASSAIKIQQFPLLVRRDEEDIDYQGSPYFPFVPRKSWWRVRRRVKRTASKWPDTPMRPDI